MYSLCIYSDFGVYSAAQYFWPSLQEWRFAPPPTEDLYPTKRYAEQCSYTCPLPEKGNFTLADIRVVFIGTQDFYFTYAKEVTE